MKTKRIIYWVVTGLVSIAFLASGVMYITQNPKLIEGFTGLGLPLYLIPFLGVAKLLGAIGIINPWFPKVREWAYAGYTFVLLGATWIHSVTNTPFTAPLMFLILVAVSYFFHKYRTVEPHTTLEIA